MLLVFVAYAASSFAKNNEEKSYYVKSVGYSSNPESDPPKYVRQLNETGVDAFKNFNWIDSGLNYRMRFENRKNDFRRSENNTDSIFLSRTQAYFGIKDIVDPLRFAIEIQDSRIHNSKFAKSVGEVNKLDLFQGYIELYFKNHRPISLRAGRMAYELMDRKLFSRDDWGNTGTNFQGFRATIGKKENDWQFDSFALRPVIKEMKTADWVNKNQWFYGAVLNWRRWSDSITLQPFYFLMNQERSINSERIRINSPGLRFFGTFDRSAFDYDFIGVYQFGENADQTHRAYAYSSEIGYSFDTKWNPRLSAIYGYASGDKNPFDNKNQRFERFYGFNRPWSNSNHIEWENLETLKSRIQFKPRKKFKIESSYSFYWLASASDEWKRGKLRDESGGGGRFIGQDLDVRVHYDLSRCFKTTLGYAHFVPGKFARSSGRGGASDFIYFELGFNIFGQR